MAGEFQQLADSQRGVAGEVLAPAPAPQATGPPRPALVLQAPQDDMGRVERVAGEQHRIRQVLDVLRVRVEAEAGRHRVLVGGMAWTEVAYNLFINNGSLSCEPTCVALLGEDEPRSARRGPTLRAQWLGQQLRELREANGMTLDDAAGYL